MPGAQERALRRRINSVQSTKKITRAMELIAATRVVRAQQRANAARPYAEHITGVIRDLSAAGASVSHPLLRRVERPRRVGFVVITSDRGLAGAYNASVIRAAEREIQAAQTELGADYSLVLVGKKSSDYFRFRHYRIDAGFTGMSDSPEFEDAREVATIVRDAFEGGAVDRVELVYTRFVSIGVQRVAVRRFLPLDTGAEDPSADAGALAGFEFEPSAEGVLSELLPRYVEARVLAALLDAAASEHASRQRAMKAATDNAEELIVKLTRQLNRARQDAITTEITEIIGGAEGLIQSRSSAEDLLPDHLTVRDLFADRLTRQVTGAPQPQTGSTP